MASDPLFTSFVDRSASAPPGLNKQLKPQTEQPKFDTAPLAQQPEYQLMSDDEQSLQKFMDKALEAFRDGLNEDQKNLMAVEIFLSDEGYGRLRLGRYKGKYIDRAKDVLLRVQSALRGRGVDLRLYFRGTSSSDLFRDTTSVEFKEFDLFRKAVSDKIGNQPGQDSVKNLITQWIGEIISGLDDVEIELERLEHIANPSNYFLFRHQAVDRTVLELVITSASKCHDKRYMEKFVEVIRACCKEKPQFHLPFVFLCAPSGTGKSVFGTNLGNTILPSLHWISKSVGVGQQECYIPFKHFSDVINASFEYDLKRYSEYFKSKYDRALQEDSLGVDQLSTEARDFKFESVYLLVNLYRELYRIRELSKTAENPLPSWLRSQFEIEDFSKDEMTFSDGFIELRNLSRGDPILAFVDECSLLDSDRAVHPSDWNRQLHHFMRSLLRTIGVVPIITGTDARASNFCYSMFNHSGKGLAVWAIIFNDCPDFNLATFDQKCADISERFKISPLRAGIVRVLDFLKLVRVNENPFLIAVALEYLYTLPVDEPISLRCLIDELLYQISVTFMARKERLHFFNIGQQAYITSHYWNEGTLNVRVAGDVCINGHLARLVGWPDECDQPYFTLKVIQHTQRYANRPDNIPWTPKSYYASFHLAPLTGLMLFGLNLTRQHIGGSYHVPFATEDNDSRRRLSSLDAILSEYSSHATFGSDMAIEHAPTGTGLELLLQIGAVAASREIGVNGTSLPVFLWKLIREFDSNLLIYRGPQQQSTSLSGRYRPFPYSHAKLKILGENSLDKVIVPVLAPMAVPEWPKSVYDLLGAGDDGPLHLGVFQPSFANSPADCVIFETNLPGMIAAPEPAFLSVEGKRRRVGPTPPPIMTAATIEAAGTAGEKVYGFPGIETRLVCTMNREIRVVIECKFWKHRITISNLRTQIVEQKFCKDIFSGCNTFVVVALFASKFENANGSEHLKWMNDNRFYIWFLKRVATKGEHFFQLTPVEGQPGNVRESRNVIVLGLTEIWEDDEVLRTVMSKWSKELVTITGEPIVSFPYSPATSPAKEEPAIV